MVTFEVVALCKPVKKVVRLIGQNRHLCDGNIQDVRIAFGSVGDASGDSRIPIDDRDR